MFLEKLVFFCMRFWKWMLYFFFKLFLNISLNVKLMVIFFRYGVKLRVLDVFFVNRLYNCFVFCCIKVLKWFILLKIECSVWVVSFLFWWCNGLKLLNVMFLFLWLFIWKEWKGGFDEKWLVFLERVFLMIFWLFKMIMFL